MDCVVSNTVLAPKTRHFAIERFGVDDFWLSAPFRCFIGKP